MFPIRDHNPSQKVPYVTYALMAANILVFIVFLLPNQTDERALLGIYRSWALIPAAMDAAPETLLTSIFLHGGFMHLAGNMLFLWIYGDNMEEELGHLPYLAFYLAAGIAAGLVHVASDPGSVIPTVGASGAIAGVMGGYLLLFPKAKVDVLFIFIIIFRIIPIPAWIVLGLWMVFQFAGGFTALSGQGGVAYWAHIGGFLAGLLMTGPVWLRRGGPAYWDRTDGHPPHPDAQYRRTTIPVVRR